MRRSGAYSDTRYDGAVFGALCAVLLPLILYSGFLSVEHTLYSWSLNKVLHRKAVFLIQLERSKTANTSFTNKIKEITQSIAQTQASCFLNLGHMASGTQAEYEGQLHGLELQVALSMHYNEKNKLYQGYIQAAKEQALRAWQAQEGQQTVVSASAAAAPHNQGTATSSRRRRSRRHKVHKVAAGAVDENEMQEFMKALGSKTDHLYKVKHRLA